VTLVVARSAARNVDVTLRRFLLALGSLVAFSAGGGKVGLAIGPLLPLLESLPVEVPILFVLVGGGLGLLAGSWMASTRMIKALTQDYSELGPRRSIAVLIPSFAIAQAAILFGLPMSFNEIFVSTIVGSGLVAGGSAVSRSKVGYTLLAWVVSLVLSLALSYGALVALRGL
jgi:PiT family inorganic phosphate transporter